VKIRCEKKAMLNQSHFGGGGGFWWRKMSVSISRNTLLISMLTMRTQPSKCSAARIEHIRLQAYIICSPISSPTCVFQCFDFSIEDPLRVASQLELVGCPR
jgi:hypothetical protein